MFVTTISADVKLQKTPTSTFPNVRDISSIDVELNPHTPMQDLYDSLLDISDAGQAITIGPFKKQLKRESRKGQSKKDALTNLIVLDIDGFDMSAYIDDDIVIENLPEQFIKLLPEYLQDVSYVWQWSAKYATNHIQKPHMINAHLFFLTTEPTTPTHKKWWFHSLNLDLEPFRSQLTLSSHYRTLSYVIDTCMGQNSRIVYVTPMANFPINYEHITVALKGNDTFNLPAIAELNAEIIVDDRNALIKELRSQLNLPATPDSKLFGVKYNNKIDQEVLNDSGRGLVSPVTEDEHYIRVNINGGDSAGYFIYKSNPTYVHNFKGEPIFSLNQFDPDFYRNLLDGMSEDQDPNDLTTLGPLYQLDDTGQIVFGFFDRNQDTYNSCIHHPEQSAISTKQHSGIEKLNIVLNNYERTLLDNDTIPTWEQMFDPASLELISFIDRKLNLYHAPRTLRMTTAKSLDSSINPKQLTYGNDTAILLKTICPTIHALIKNAAGCPKRDDTSAETEHLIHWLAWIIQNRTKTRTSWLFQGDFGTGKSAITDILLKKVLGHAYAVSKKFSQLKDQFNADLNHLLVVNYDEANFDNDFGFNVMEDIKQMISGKELNIRDMRKTPENTVNHTNFIFCTNNTDAFKVQDNERRFNITPYQRTRLEEILPLRDEEYDFEGNIDRELDQYIAFSLAFKTLKKKVRFPIYNQAKHNLAEATLTFPELFAQALNQGDAQWFIDNLPSQKQIDTIRDMTPRMYLQRHKVIAARVIYDWLHQLKPERVEGPDLIVLYNTLHNTNAKEVRNTKVLKRHGINFAQYRKTGQSHKIMMTVEKTQWKYTPEEREDMIMQLDTILNPDPDTDLEAPNHVLDAIKDTLS